MILLVLTQIYMLEWRERVKTSPISFQWILAELGLLIFFQPQFNCSFTTFISFIHFSNYIIREVSKGLYTIILIQPS